MSPLCGPIAALLSVFLSGLSAQDTAGRGDEGLTPAATPADGVVTLAGSTTVAPFARAVSRRLDGTVRMQVRPSGSATGLSLLCTERARERPDIAASSRPISAAELRACAENGASRLIEVPIGRDGIVMAQAKGGPALELSALDVYRAVARTVPRGPEDCVLVPNRAERWADVRTGLPNRPILFIGPPLTSGAREAFLEEVLLRGARQYPCLSRLEKESPYYFAEATAIRDDGRWIDGGEHDSAVAVTLDYVKEAIGLFGFVHLTADDSLRPIAFEGVFPTRTTIADGDYALSRTLYLYALSDTLTARPLAVHVLHSFQTFGASGPDGYLTRRGLITEGVAQTWFSIDAVAGTKRPIPPLPSALQDPQIRAVEAATGGAP